MVKLSEEDLREESKGWATLVVLVRSLSRRVAMEMVARDFWLWARLKEEVAGYGFEKGFLLF